MPFYDRIKLCREHAAVEQRNASGFPGGMLSKIYPSNLVRKSSNESCDAWLGIPAL